MVRLFIEEREVELDDSVQFAITKQFEDITNPTSIINSWSKSIDIPFTEKNNQLFGNLFDPDRTILSGNTLVGMYFDPHKKINFRLDWGDYILMQGYLKVNEIKQKDGKGSYNVTLFGELGKIFSELKKITMDLNSDEDEKYILDTRQYVSEALNAELVSQSWNSNGQSSFELKDSNGQAYAFDNYVGFAPNNSKNDGFDYNSYQSNYNTILTFAETLENSYFTEKTGISVDSALEDGMSQRGIGEYRSYLQLPFVYWNKLFRMFIEKAQELTGYQFKLDSGWFNIYNPYWYKLVYMLQNLHYEETDDYELSHTSAKQKSTYNFFTHNSEQMDYTVPLYNELIPNSGSGFDMEDDTLNVFLKTDISLERTATVVPNWTIRADNAFIFTFTLKDTDGTTMVSKELVIQPNNFIVQTTFNSPVISVGSAVNGNIVANDVVINFPIEKWMLDKQFTIETSVRLLRNIFPANDSQGQGIYVYYKNPEIYVSDGTIGVGSDMNFNINRVWNNEYVIFDEILKYCKMFRLGFFVDEFAKEITIQPLRNYFKSYTIEDWSDKVDKNKDYVIKPIAFEDKYVLFNTTDSETKIGKNYLERYGINYGNYRLISDYNFNDNTKELFNEIPTSILYTPNVLGWQSIYDRNEYIYTIPVESYVHCSDDEGNNVSCFGQFYFHNGIVKFDKGEGLNRSIFVSDDTDFQRLNKIHCYTQMSDGKRKEVLYYPCLSATISSGTFLDQTITCIYFNKPKEKYTYDLINNYDKAQFIYNLFWENYIEERYNVQNKIITCYVKLSPLDWNSFSFRKFVMVGNQLCMVNKIYDYNIDESDTTKVDLITINNISGYTE